MHARQRWTILALAGVLGAITGLVALAGPRAVPARTAQFPGSAEPPLADSARPPAAAPVAPPAAPPVADPGTFCPEDPPPPVVSLRIRVPSTAAPGQELEYQICIENRSNAPAHQVIVRNPLPANARFVRADPAPNTREPELTWNLGTLEGCACRQIILVLAPTGESDVIDCARVQFEHGECVTTKITRPSLCLRKCGPETAVVGQTLNYQLCVCNNGGADAVGVVITDEIPAGLEHASGKKFLTYDVGTLAPGQSRCFDYQVIARTGGRHCNRAVAATPTGVRDAAEHCVTVGDARMTLAKTGPERRYVGLPTTYQITVTNTGTFALDNVVIRDTVPAGAALVRAPGGQVAGNDVQWFIGNLPPGASRTVEIVLRVDNEGKVCNRAIATSDRGVTAQAEACTDFIGVSGLHVAVHDIDVVPVGGEERYVIDIVNQGTAAITGIKLEITAPDEMAVTRVTGDAADHRKEGQKVFTQPFNLGPKKSAQFTVYGTAQKAGSVRFKVDATADQLTSGPVHVEESTTFFLENPAPAPRP
jgi:uncharacterized repeat protein (TIGR01451 family)